VFSLYDRVLAPRYLPSVAVEAKGTGWWGAESGDWGFGGPWAPRLGVKGFTAWAEAGQGRPQTHSISAFSYHLTNPFTLASRPPTHPSPTWPSLRSQPGAHKPVQACSSHLRQRAQPLATGALHRAQYPVIGLSMCSGATINGGRELPYWLQLVSDLGMRCLRQQLDCLTGHRTKTMTRPIH
jgi:hypothetical protein